MSASILIRTRNEARRLADCLAAVFAQQGPPFEVLVLDSGSTDDTLRIARGFPVRLLEMPAADFTYGYALNEGFAAARAPFLVALSGHSIPRSRRWLATLVGHFEDPGVVGVSGPEVNRWAPAPLPYPVAVTADQLLGDPRLGFSNFNAAVRRQAWERFPFHEALPYGEDKEWAWHQLRAGARIIVDGAAAVDHEHHESLRAVWRRGRREALGQVAWRGVRPYPLALALRLAVRRACANAACGGWDRAGLLGPFAYFHGRYRGFAEAHRQPLRVGPRRLARPRPAALDVGVTGA